MEPNSFTKTSFCNVEIDNITTNKTKEYILNNLNLICNLQYNTRYAKIYNEQYSKNLNNPHVFHLKSSGTPYLLFLTQINNVNYNILIDKKTNQKYSYPKILIVPYIFTDQNLYNGTLFECELIRDKKNKWYLSMNDIYYLNGKSQKKTVIIDRINTIHKILDDSHEESEYSKNGCKIFVKKYFDYKDIDYVKNEYIPKLPYNTRGIYFIPLRVDYSNILYLFERDNSNNSVKKDKIKDNQKVFRIVKTLKPDVYELYLMDDNNLIKKGIACVQNTSMSHKLLNFFKNKNQMDEIKVLCEYNDKFNKWKPLSLSNMPISSV